MTDDTMVTFSIRCWTRQRDFLREAAESRGGLAEYVMHHMLPVAAKDLGRAQPDCPPIDRRHRYAAPLTDRAKALAAELGFTADQVEKLRILFGAGASRDSGFVTTRHDEAAGKAKGKSRR